MLGIVHTSEWFSCPCNKAVINISHHCCSTPMPPFKSPSTLILKTPIGDFSHLDNKVLLPHLPRLSPRPSTPRTDSIGEWHHGPPIFLPLNFAQKPSSLVSSKCPKKETQTSWSKLSKKKKKKVLGEQKQNCLGLANWRAKTMISSEFYWRPNKSWVSKFFWRANLTFLD